MKLIRRMESASRYVAAVYRTINYNINRQNSDESHCRYISSRGIKKSCRVWSESGAGPTVEQLKQSAGSRSLGPTTIYVKTEHILEFVDQSLDRVETPFILVTGDCDDEVGESHIPAASLQRILDHPMLEI